MSEIASSTRLPRLPRLWRRGDVRRAELPALPARTQVARASLVVVCLLCGGLVLQLWIVSGASQRATQQQLFDQFRADLAQSTAPVGPVDQDGHVVEAGTPVSYLEIPAIGLRQIVVEGTSPSDLLSGPGHRRDSPLPGQAGVSIILGRRAAYGGPFARIGELDRGDTLTVTTGQGVFEFSVVGVRREGDPLPAPVERGESRVVLATAAGRPYLPDGVLRVDAELDDDGVALAGPARLVSAQTLPASEDMLGIETGRIWALVLWLEVMVALAVGFVWAWHRWGRAQAWVAFLPPMALVALFTSDQFALLLPNLL